MKQFSVYLRQFLLIALITLVLLELTLQGLALVVQNVEGRKQPVSWGTNNLRILALGDSNTFGIAVEEDQAYPAQLETLWNSQRDADIPAIEVINLGYPGSNSWRVRANMESMLERFQPDVVLVMIGANDIWTPAETMPLDNNVTPLSKLKKWSRVYRLFYMLRRETFDRSQLATDERVTEYVTAERTLKIDDMPNDVIEQKMNELMTPNTREEGVAFAVNRPDLKYGDERFDMTPDDGVAAGTIAGLAPNLVALHEMTEAYNARLILLTYPANIPFYRDATDVVRGVSNEKQFDMIDVAEEFIGDCPQAMASCESLFLFDGHLRARGYNRMAQFVVTQLRQTLQMQRSGTLMSTHR